MADDNLFIGFMNLAAWVFSAMGKPVAGQGELAATAAEGVR